MSTKLGQRRGLQKVIIIEFICHRIIKQLSFLSVRAQPSHRCKNRDNRSDKPDHTVGRTVHPIGHSQH